MKKLYFILLLVAVSLFLILLNVVLSVFSVPLLGFFMEKYGLPYNFVIRGSAILASILTGFLVAFPMGYFTRRKSMLYGFAMPLIGIITLSQPWKLDNLRLLTATYLEWSVLFLSCGLFWYLGQRIRSKTKNKIFFITYFIILGIVSILLFFEFSGLISPMTSCRIEMPKELSTSGILVGTDFLSKDIFVQDERLGTITDIKFGEFDPSSGSEIGIVGTKGVLFLDENINIKSSVMFNVRAGHVDIVDVEGDNICEYLDRGGGWQDVSLIEHQGNSIWTYGGGMPGVDDICAGDIDGDGMLEFVVGFNGDGGVSLLDKNAKEKWNQPDGNVWHVELVDTNDDGALEIVHSNACGKITVRDSGGNIVSQAIPEPYFSDFSICTWPTKKDREYALLAENDTIWIFDFDGRVVAQFNAPQCGELGDARGVPIKIKAEEPEYFAVVVEFTNWEKSILYIYDSNNNLIYQEIIPEACASIASIPIDTTDKEALLIGGNSKVWRYSAPD